MATYQSTHTGAQIDAAVDAVDEKLPLTGGTVTGNLTVNGNISTQGIVKLDNEQSVQFKDSGSTYRSMLGLTSSNNCLVGSGTIQASGNTIVLGKNLYFRANSTSENALTIDTNKAATFASSVTATSFIGNLTGNADTATSATTADKLSVVSKTMMGRTYWTSGGVPTNIKGTLYMISDESDASTLTNSAKLKFNSYDADGTQIKHSPYIQAITASSSSYGRKRLSVFQSNTTNWNDDFTEVFTILPNGRVGIGTTAPTQLLEVAGNASITGTLMLGGTAVAVVYSGSTAPSSSTGSDGDIYIQTS